MESQMMLVQSWVCWMKYILSMIIVGGMFLSLFTAGKFILASLLCFTIC